MALFLPVVVHDEIPKIPDKLSGIRIAHLSDIHIQKHKLVEYKPVFECMYELLGLAKPNLICVTGDVFHNMESSKDHEQAAVGELFAKLRSIAPVILLMGNHDVNVRAPADVCRDLLTPVLAGPLHGALPDIFFFKRSGVYAAHGILWIILAPNEHPMSADFINERCAAIIKSDAGYSKALRICLFHTTVLGAKLPNGQTSPGDMKTFPIPICADFLETFDAALGGHIHLYQGGVRWAYAGSLIQQDIGEPVDGHGFLLWDFAGLGVVPRRTHITVPGSASMFDVFLRMAEEKLLCIPPSRWPAHATKYRVFFSHDVPFAQALEVKTHLTKLYKCAPSVFELDIVAPQPIVAVATHNTYIEKILTNYESSTIDVVRRIYSEHYKPVIRTNEGRVRLLGFEFKNMFCYRATNYVDFTKLEHAFCGIVAGNGRGKSALLDSLVMAMYDKNPRGSKKAAFNAHDPAYYIKLAFEKNEQRGVVEKYPYSGTSVSYKFHFKGADLSSAKAVDTIREIKQYLGSYEDAALTVIMSANTENDFVYLDGPKRQAALAHLLAIGDFTEQHAHAKNEQILAKRDLDRASKYTKLPELPAVFNLEHLQTQLVAQEAHLAELNLKNLRLAGAYSQEYKFEKINTQQMEIEIQTALQAAALDVLDTSELNRLIVFKPIVSGMPATPIPSAADVLDVETKLREAQLLYEQDVEKYIFLCGACVQKPEIKVYNLPAKFSAKFGSRPTQADLITACEIWQSNPDKFTSPPGELLPLSEMLQLIKQYRICVPADENAIYHKLEIALTHIFSDLESKRIEAAYDVLSRAAYWNIQDTTQYLSDLSAYEQHQLKLAAALAKKLDTASTLDELKNKRGLIYRKRAACIYYIQNLQDQLTAAIQNNHKYAEYTAKAQTDTESKYQQQEKINIQLAQITAKIKQTQRNIIAATTEREITKINVCSNKRAADELSETSQRYRVYSAYVQLLDPRTGMAGALLGDMRQQLNTRIRIFLSEAGAGFQANIDTDFELNLSTPGTQISLSPGQLSGYERFVLSLSCRLALSQLAAVPLPDCLIIDEGFGACDEVNQAHIINFLSKLPGMHMAPRLLIVVSHLDSIKSHLDKSLDIRDIHGSRSISNTTADEIADLFSELKQVCDKKIRRNHIQPGSVRRIKPVDVHIHDIKAATINPQPELKNKPADAKEAAGWYCDKCRKYFSKSSRTKHLKTAAHIKML